MLDAPETLDYPYTFTPHEADPRMDDPKIINMLERAAHSMLRDIRKVQLPFIMLVRLGEDHETDGRLSFWEFLYESPNKLASTMSEEIIDHTRNISHY